MSYKKLFSVFLILFVFFISTIFAFREIILIKVASVLIKDQRPMMADVIVVPGGGDVQRVRKGLDLYKSGFGKYFFLTGDIKGWPGIDDGTWADLSKKFLLKNGVNEENIFLIHSTSTKEDIKRSFKLMRKKGFSSCNIVSSIFHTGRIYRIAEKDAESIEFKVVASKNYEYNKFNWWKTEKGLLFFFNEIIKTLYYEYKGFI